MTARQFSWGLSNGIIALAVAGTFWLGYGIGPHLGETGWVMPAVFTILLYGTFGAIVWFALRLRRRAGFKRSELRLADERQRAETRKIMMSFLFIVIVQAVLIALGVFLCLRLGREELLGQLIALVVSLHFIPLGRVFHVRPYYFVGTAGAAISLLAFSPIFGIDRMTFLGITMGVTVWLSAVYILWRADRITSKAIGESWSV
jgi:cbb3-type cytochrome oxidase subunit 3